MDYLNVGKFVSMENNELITIDGGTNWWYVVGGCAAIVSGVAGGIAADWTGVGAVGTSGIAMIKGA